MQEQQQQQVMVHNQPVQQQLELLPVPSMLLAVLLLVVLVVEHGHLAQLFAPGSRQHAGTTRILAEATWTCGHTTAAVLAATG